MKGRTGIACLVVLALGVTGCSGGGAPSPSATSRVKNATAGGQKFKPVELPDTAAQLAELVKQQSKISQTVRVSATSSAEGRAGKSSVEINGLLVRPSGKQGAAHLKIVEVGGPNAGTTQIMLGGGVIYARTEGETYPNNASWLQLSRQDLAAVRAEGGFVREGYEQALNSAEQALRQTSTDGGVAALAYGRFTRNPEWETVAGTKVRRYSGTTDTIKLAKATGDPSLRQMIAGGFREYPWTIWIDSYGLPFQFNSTVSLPKAGTITSKATYTAWGQPLTITFPSEKDVATAFD